MTEREIFTAICGTDQDNVSNAVCAVKMLYVKGVDIDKDVDDIDEIITDEPIVNIYKDGSHAMIDLTFTDPQDYEFINLVSRLQDFQSNYLNMIPEDRLPLISLTVSPRRSGGSVYVTGINAMWCVMPSAIGRYNDTVRFMFDSELLSAFELDMEQSKGDMSYGQQ